MNDLVKEQTEGVFRWFRKGVRRMRERYVVLHGITALPYFADYLERNEYEIMARITRRTVGHIRAELDGEKFMRLVERAARVAGVPSPVTLLFITCLTHSFATTQGRI